MEQVAHHKKTGLAIAGPCFIQSLSGVHQTLTFQPLTAGLQKAGLSHFTYIVDTANNMLFGSNDFDYEVLSDLTHATAEFINDDFSIYQGLVDSELFELPKQAAFFKTVVTANLNFMRLL